MGCKEVLGRIKDLFEGKKHKRIIVFTRVDVTNSGDWIIGECCQYLIEKVAREEGVEVTTTISNITEKDRDVLEQQIANHDIIVFPGGGINTIKYAKITLKIIEMASKMRGKEVYINAIGVSRRGSSNKDILAKIVNHPLVKQISTRGDLKTMESYIEKPRKYPTKWIFDPAMWVGEAYDVNKKENAKVIGVGLIRPEIFKLNGYNVSEEEVKDIYIKIIHELEARGHVWKFFTNGMVKDYALGVKILEEIGRKVNDYMDDDTEDRNALVRKIASFKGIIAARMHANIIATALEVPTVALVWNDKMNMFAEIINYEDRYIEVNKDTDISKLVDKFEQALEEGYNKKHIAEIKKISVETIKNIIC